MTIEQQTKCDRVVSLFTHPKASPQRIEMELYLLSSFERIYVIGKLRNDFLLDDNAHTEATKSLNIAWNEAKFRAALIEKENIKPGSCQ